jgi:hypothetical protein
MPGTAPIARLVVRPPNWLGDVVLALPAMAAIRRAFPDADLTVAAPATIAALFHEVTPAAPDRVLELPRGSKAAIAALAGGGFDAGLLFPNSFRSAWDPRSVGVRDGRPRPAPHAPQPAPAAQADPASRRLLSRARSRARRRVRGGRAAARGAVAPKRR